MSNDEILMAENALMESLSLLCLVADYVDYMLGNHWFNGENYHFYRMAADCGWRR
jgi:hypothetical protein